MKTQSVSDYQIVLDSLTFDYFDGGVPRTRDDWKNGPHADSMRSRWRDQAALAVEALRAADRLRVPKERP